MERKKLQEMLLWADRLCRWTISLIFLAAAVPKLTNIQEFAATIDAYAVLPAFFLLPTAVGLPVLEIFLALGLFLNHRQSKIGIAVLLLFFVSLLSYSIRQGLDIDCGCFGPEDPEYTAFKGLRVALVRDIVMLLPLAYSFWYHRYRHYTFQIEGD